MPSATGTWWSGFLRGAWITGARARAVARVLLIVQVALFLVVIAGTHGLLVETGPQSTDYISFYAAGRLATEGNAALAYDPAAHHALEQAITEPGIDHKFFFYPPIFLLLCVPLSLLPYLVSFVVFQAATLAAFLMVIRPLLPTGGMILVLAYPALYWAMGLGQNSFLTATLFAAALLALDRRPFLAGLLFGAVCYKPHFGLLVPVVLMVSGRWVAVASAVMAVIGLAFMSLAFFGVEAWSAYLAAASGAGAVYETGRINLAGYVTVFGGARLLGLPVGVAYGVQIVVALTAGLAVAWIWRIGADLPTRAAALLAGTLLVVPLALLYDLMLLLPAILWMIRLGQERGFMAGEKPLLAFAYLTPLFVLGVGMGVQIPLGPLASASVLGLCLARAGLAGRSARFNTAAGSAG